MNIGIDISQIAFPGTGVARFTDGLMNAICSFDTVHRWTFFYSSLRVPLYQEVKQKIQSSKHRIFEFRIPPTVLSLIWNSAHIFPVELFIGPFDIFISSDWTEPPSKHKKVTIVHDLAFMRYPETVHTTILQTQKKRMSWVAKESQLIIADSHATQNDLNFYFPNTRNKVKTIYPGVEPSKEPHKDPAPTLKKFNLQEPFILTVGKLEPRKNISSLLKAYQNVSRKKTMPQLVIVGEKGWDTHLTTLLVQNSGVKLLGRIDDTDLATLYANCLFFIYPSLWEGFGYPVIEAMHYGAPVAVSHTSSLAEISNGAAFTFNPFNIHSIENAFETLFQNKTLRANLKKKGTIRAQEFSWTAYIKALEFELTKL